jgi:aspartate racemase
MPTVLLWSDPTIVDRTAALLSGRARELAAETAQRSARLIDAGATKIVFCCVTLHAIAALLPPSVQRRLLSLVDVIIGSVETTAAAHLLLCTEGTRRAEVFQRDPRWHHVSSRVRFLNEADQRELHDAIYRIKRNVPLDEHVDLVCRLARRYGVESCIAGCTELHIVAKHFRREPAAAAVCRWLDPLTIVAARIAARDSIISVT